MSESDLLIDEREGILEVVLNRPKKHNAINQSMLDGLLGAVRCLAARPDVSRRRQSEPLSPRVSSRGDELPAARG
jgi:hypothetical protein